MLKFLRTLVAPRPRVQTRGAPLHINVPDSSRKTVRRHLGRLSRLRVKPSTPQREAEIQRRATLLHMAGISVPDDPASLRAMAEEYRK